MQQDARPVYPPAYPSSTPIGKSYHRARLALTFPYLYHLVIHPVFVNQTLAALGL